MSEKISLDSSDKSADIEKIISDCEIQNQSSKQIMPYEKN